MIIIHTDNIQNHRKASDNLVIVLDRVTYVDNHGSYKSDKLTVYIQTHKIEDYSRFILDSHSYEFETISSKAIYQHSYQ